ncbi:unnamed protein product, partial [Rotaria sp. Silwood1]
MRYMQDNSSVIVDGRGNQAYVLATAPIYAEWVRNNYELQVWQRYFKMGTQDKHWEKKKKRINGLTSNIAQASATITNLQVQLSTYWSQTTAGAINPITATTSSASANTGRIRDAVDPLEKAILKYIQHSTKRVEYDLPPKFISNANFTFKIDELIISKEEAQIVYDQMRQLSKEYRIQAMSLYLQAITREKEILKNEIEFVVKGFSQENDEGFNIEPDAGYIAFKHYNELREKRPRFIYNDPQTASRRCTTELAMLKRKIEAQFFQKKSEPRKINRKYKQQRERIPYDNLLETIQLNQYQISKCPITTEKKKNYGRLIKRLTNWITQKQYERVSIKSNEVELAHLYYLPKAHKPGTPLRPIISGLKHPTKKISKFLDELLRPLFNKMASNTTVTCGTEVIKQLHEWSKRNIRQETLICTMDVMDLYTMIPQTEAEAIIRLCRFVIQNNYFSYNGKYFHQVHGGAMGSPLTLTIANCYMYFYERDIVKQVNNSNGLYLRYIDDIFIIINWPIPHLSKQINRWNELDLNIKLKAQVGHSTNFLDLYIENKNGELFTKVYHKPSYEPYYLPFNSVHPIHM